MKKVLIALAILIGLGVSGFYGYYYALTKAWIKFNEYDIRTEGLLQVGDRAPDLPLARVDGEGRSRLSDFYSEKPLILAFGSYT